MPAQSDNKVGGNNKVFQALLGDSSASVGGQCDGLACLNASSGGASLALGSAANWAGNRAKPGHRLDRVLAIGNKDDS